MSLELLANEILFDVFEYLSSVDLFHSFNGLNYRFDNLLLGYFRQNKHFDFRLIYKEDLNLIRRRYLPLFINEITSIDLSNDDTNPNEIDLFISRLYPLHRFNNLHSITLYNIYSIEKIIRILDDLKHMSHLTHLNFKQNQIQYNPKTLHNIMNTIWSLPNLTHCCLDLISNGNCHIMPPTIISCSLKHLSITNFQCDMESLLVLYEHTPYIEYLSVKLCDSSNDYPQLPLLYSLTTLNIICEDSFRLVETLLRKTPNLINLTIELNNINIIETKWQDIIQKHLSSLKTFNLQSNFHIDDCDNIEDEIDRMINLYQTYFWIEQHKWFIRCICSSENNSHNIHLHTLPYKFKNYSINTNEIFLIKSTCPQDQQYLKYNSVQNLQYNSSSLDDINTNIIQFLNIRYLTLTLPYDNQFQIIIPRFDNLIYLEIRMDTRTYDDNDLFQLQNLINQTPRLYYLKFYSWSTILTKFESKNKKNVNIKMPPYSIQSSSVRHLNLQGWNYSGNHQFYNEQQCLSLIQSPLGQQCQYLLIEVDKRANIIHLVQKMKYLRALNVRCNDRKDNEELIKWLKPRLPSTCTFANDSTASNEIRLWIR
ncbi:unnamed protein product [Adineta steineri]|uniref:F-box domain-containing protein n=1 Tax=Adineta steineri TaxID=433720 RepID=A0A818JCA0_9BILA|nr:unnamed protein product [Adineta steineri]CAF3539506.1 unnamed protein product [Adineta steineri]